MLALQVDLRENSSSKFTKNGSFNAGTDGGLCRCRDGRESKVFPTRFHLTPLRSNRYGETYRGSVVVFLVSGKMRIPSSIAGTGRMNEKGSMIFISTI